MPLVQDTVIDGRFQIIRALGRGGMGVVYEAIQLGLDRVVALKVIDGVTKESEKEVVRFQREALVLSKLSHVNIVQFYAYGNWNGLPYIAMELLLGQSLQQLLAMNEPLHIASTIEYASQICRGLEHAHASGIFHRDIKPTNIILSIGPDRRPVSKIIDFGLAKLTGMGVQQLTQTNAALGSVLYMSPEQCMGSAVDGRSDIYSLGCLLYHCLTGQSPFRADNAIGVMFLHVNEPIENTAGWPLLPTGLQEVVARCMAKNPADRYQYCAQLEENLILAGQANSVPVSIPYLANQIAPNKDVRCAAPPKSSRNKVLHLVLASLVIGLSGIFWYTQHVYSPKNQPVIAGLNSPKEIMTSFIHQDDRWMIERRERFRFAPAEMEQLRQATEQLRHDPTHEATLVLQAYEILSRHYLETLQTEKLRTVLSAATKYNIYANNIQYISLLTRHHELCLVSGCELSLMDKLIEAKERFPRAVDFNQYQIELYLSQDYIKLGQYKRARDLLLSIVKTNSNPNQLRAAKEELKHLDDIETALNRINVLTSQLQQQSKAKKCTAVSVCNLVLEYRRINKDPLPVILQELAKPANSPYAIFQLQFALGAAYLARGNTIKCEEVWKGMIEPLRMQARLSQTTQSARRALPIGTVRNYRCRVVFGLAMLYLETGRYQECINLKEQWFQDSMDTQRGCTRWTDLLRVCWAHAHRRLSAAAEAEKLYRQAIENFSRKVQVDGWRSEALCGLACLLYSRGQYKESLAYMKEAIAEEDRIGTGMVCYRLLSASCMDKLNLVDQAAAEWKKVKYQVRNTNFKAVHKRWHIFEDVVPLSSLDNK